MTTGEHPVLEESGARIIDRHFGLGSIVNLFVILTGIVSVTLYISSIRAEVAENKAEVSTKIEGIEHRLDRDAAMTNTTLARIELKIDSVGEKLDRKADRSELRR